MMGIIDSKGHAADMVSERVCCIDDCRMKQETT